MSFMLSEFISGPASDCAATDTHHVFVCSTSCVIFLFSKCEGDNIMLLTVPFALFSFLYTVNMCTV